jgi:DNA-binding CsgD family transcriptional regulator
VPTSLPAARLAPGTSSSGRLATRALRLLNRAALDAVRGHESSCRASAAEAGILAHRAGLIVLDIAADHVLGLLELSMRNLPIAAWHLMRCERMAKMRRPIDQYLVRFEPDLVEVLLALGRRTEARLIAASLTVRIDRAPLPWSTVAAARCCGMLAGEATFEAEFMTAVSLASVHGTSFDYARTELCFGERLRRARRRVEARDHIGRALQAFDAMGLTPWSERAARELQATSSTTRRRGDSSTIDELTPQEEHAARVVASGATVREAAGQMFLSPKTVEAHLGRAYRKLGVHNRAQLTVALAREGSGS